MTEEITSLEGLTSGRFIVTTYNGTRHFIDLDAKTSTRMGAPGREWGREVFVGELGTVGGSRPKALVRSFVTEAPDGTPFHYWSITGAEVGKSMRLENMDEWRTTSSVQYIERWEPDGDESKDADGTTATE